MQFGWIRIGSILGWYDWCSFQLVRTHSRRTLCLKVQHQKADHVSPRVNGFNGTFFSGKINAHGRCIFSLCSVVWWSGYVQPIYKL